MPWQTRDAQGSMQSAHDVLEILPRVSELDEALHVVTQLLQEIRNVLVLCRQSLCQCRAPEYDDGIADLWHRQLMRGDRGARFRVISNYQPRRRRVVVSRIPVEHGLRERDGVFRISRFHGLRRRRHDQRGPNCRDAGPRDLGAAGRGKRGHVPYLGGSLGPEKVGQPAAADAPELRAAVRVKRYSPTVPAMVGLRQPLPSRIS